MSHGRQASPAPNTPAGRHTPIRARRQAPTSTSSRFSKCKTAEARAEQVHHRAELPFFVCVASEGRISRPGASFDQRFIILTDCGDITAVYNPGTATN